jgi:hypothetical protein
MVTRTLLTVSDTASFFRGKWEVRKKILGKGQWFWVGEGYIF